MAEKIINLLEEIETSIPVQDWEYSGIHIWPLVRSILSFEVVAQNCKKKEAYNKSNSNLIKSYIQKITGYGKVLISKIRDYKHNRIKNSAEVLLLGRSSARNTQIDGKWIDTVLDSFNFYLNKLEIPAIHVEYDSLNIIRIPRYSSSLLIHNNMEFSKLKTRLKLKFSKIKAPRLPEYPKFLEILSSNGVLFSLKEEQSVLYHAQVLRSRADFFKTILKKYKIKTGFCSVYYNPESLAFVLACNELSIPSVDIQHGNQGISHFAYNYTKFDPKKNELVPDYFWVWTEYEKNTIAKWAKNHRPEVFQGGNLWVNFWLDNSNQKSKVVNNRIDAIKKKSACNSHILLSLQPNISFDFFLPYIQNSPKSWFWWIRLHPRMLEENQKITKLLEERGILNFSLDSASFLPLPLLLANVDVHVTYNSSVIIDADMFNLSSLVLAKNGRHFFPVQFDKKTAFFEESQDDAIKRIESLITLAKEGKMEQVFDEKQVTDTMKALFDRLIM